MQTHRSDWVDEREQAHLNLTPHFPVHTIYALFFPGHFMSGDIMSALSLRFSRFVIYWFLIILCPVSGSVYLMAQVDQKLAAGYFNEVEALCQKDAGRLWGISLFGPLAVADRKTDTIATNQPAPDAPKPRLVGIVNAPVKWGDERWTTVVWSMISQDKPGRRARLFIHELFHRVQDQELGLLIKSIPGHNVHMDTMEGRFWLQLEWRALAKAVSETGDAHRQALADALAFRDHRRQMFPGADAKERALEINEGLAQYTGTVLAFSSRQEMVDDILFQLEDYLKYPSLVKLFAYPLGSAYGFMLDSYAPGWTHRIKITDDLGLLVREAAKIEPSDPLTALSRYDGETLRAAEELREKKRLEHIAHMRSVFLESPVLTLPRGRQASHYTPGMTPLDEHGIVHQKYKTSGPWGQLEGEWVLVSKDGRRLTVPAPNQTKGKNLSGKDWTLTLSPGWRIESRNDNFEVVSE